MVRDDDTGSAGGVGRGADVGDELSIHPDVAKISFTGSTATGKLIAQA
jgi:aldehyde dehydrogenase (NAD+)